MSSYFGLVHRGARIDHLPGEHDDWANAAAGVVWLLRSRPEREISIRSWGGPAEGAGRRPSDLDVGHGLLAYGGGSFSNRAGVGDMARDKAKRDALANGREALVMCSAALRQTRLRPRSER